MSEYLQRPPAGPTRPETAGSMVEAIGVRRDFPMVQGTILVAAIGYVVINLLVDISYAWLDPRIKYR